MIVEFSDLSEDFFAERFDYCIAGAGIAGIVLARELSKNGRVIMIEGGGLEYSDESQDLYKGDVIGKEYFDLDFTRLRFLGGTSNHWGGMCRPMDSADFDVKPHIPWSGWPIGKGDIAPYLARTCEILEIENWPDEEPILDGSDGNIRQIDFRISPFQSFKHKYLGELKENPNIDVVLNANLFDIRLADNFGSVDHLLVRGHDTNGPSRQVKARKYTLALGGLENPRALLNARLGDPDHKIGSPNPVGRFFLEHPTFDIGTYFLTDSGRASFASQETQYFSPAVEFIGNQRIANIAARFWSIEASTAPILYEGKIKQAARREICRREIWQDLLDMLDMRVQCPPTRKVDESSDLGLIVASWEQAPKPDSRVGLSQDLDKFGLRKISLDWRLTPLERRTVREFALEMGRYLARTDYGRMKIFDWVLDDDLPWPGLTTDEVGGHHHMGTTRMARNREQGVVDSNCKMFDLENLYIAGSSVFPTSGHANPTLTIVQLALRLAQHLSRN